MRLSAVPGGGFYYACGPFRTPHSPPCGTTLATLAGFVGEWRLTRRPALRSCVGAQPQQDVSGPHRLRYHSYQFVVQRPKVGLVPQPGGEGFESLPGIVLLAVEATVYERLDAPPQGAEQGGYQQCRGHHSEG
jgi:hypothetical protein